MGHPSFDDPPAAIHRVHGPRSNPYCRGSRPWVQPRWASLFASEDLAIPSRYLIRDTEATDSIELLLVAAIVAILVLRGVLAALGFPQVGGGKLHIAHMLWGGLGMLAAIALLLIYWNPSVRRATAILAGLGFGVFIDELGKFLTSDNDYFFKPTVAILYVLFVSLFLALRSFERRHPLSAGERGINQELRGLIGENEVRERGRAYFELRRGLARGYARLTCQPWFAPAVSAGFVLVGIGDLATAIALVWRGHVRNPAVPLGQLAASAASAILIWIGIWRLRRSRLDAYHWFERSVVVSILVTQVFMFYSSQFSALGGLVVHLLIYAALRYAIDRERTGAERPASLASPAPAPSA
jgi:hypothetical protein